MEADSVRHFGVIETYEPEKQQRYLGYISGYLDKKCYFHKRSFLDWDGKPESEDAPVVGQRVSFIPVYSPSTGDFHAEDVSREAIVK